MHATPRAVYYYIRHCTCIYQIPCRKVVVRCKNKSIWKNIKASINGLQNWTLLKDEHFFLMIISTSLTSLLPLLLPLPVVFGGQIPVVDGVIGGVPSANSVNFLLETQSSTNAQAVTTTPGKLRVVENSGICGKSYEFSVNVYLHILTYYLNRNNSRCQSGIRLRRSHSHGQYMVWSNSSVLFNVLS